MGLAGRGRAGTNPEFVHQPPAEIRRVGENEEPGEVEQEKDRRENPRDKRRLEPRRKLRNQNESREQKRENQKHDYRILSEIFVAIDHGLCFRRDLPGVVGGMLGGVARFMSNVGTDGAEGHQNQRRVEKRAAPLRTKNHPQKNKHGRDEQQRNRKMHRDRMRGVPSWSRRKNEHRLCPSVSVVRASEGDKAGR
jgi:hypothetical protein